MVLFEVREERVGDGDDCEKEAVWDVNHDAFGQPNEANLVDALREGDTFIPQLSMVAVEKESNTIVGYVLLSKIHIIKQRQKEEDQTQDKEKEDDGEKEEEKTAATTATATTVSSLALAPVAVASKYQKQGIGKMLIETVLQRAKELGYSSVIVLGHSTYYPKFGFLPASTWGITCDFDVPDDAYMALELIDGSLQHQAGKVVYPKPFSEC